MSVISFGSGKNGQLGQELVKDYIDPTVVQNLKGKRIISVSCGESHSIGISHFGDVYTWGRGKEGQLGIGNDSKILYQNKPQVVKALLHERITKVACGNFHSLALSDSGKIYEWGQLHKISQNENVIGNNGSATSGDGDLIQMPGLQPGSSYYAEQSLSMYLNGEKQAINSVQMVNSNPNVDLDDIEEVEERNGDDEQSRHKHIGKIIDHIQYQPEQVLGVLANEEIIDIAAGWAFSAAVTKSGKLYTWGFNEKGQLGLSDRWFHGSPKLVTSLLHVKVKSVSCGKQHMCCLTENGLLYSWGLGIFGQLGHGKLKSYLHPVLCKYFIKPTPNENNQDEEINIDDVNNNNNNNDNDNDILNINIKELNNLIPKIKITQVVCGANFTICKSDQGKLYSFGHGEYAQLGCTTEDQQHMDWNRNNGAGSHLSYSKPTLIKSLEDKKIKFIACGHLHVIVVTEDNDTYAWGWGSSGCLGFGNKRFYLVPSLVPSLSGEEISSIAAGEKHSLIVKSSDITTFAFDYLPLIQDKQSSDIIFKVQDKKVYAHTFIIKSRCPKLYSIILFDQRFNTCKNNNGDPLMEDNKRIIELNNVKYQIFFGLINYLYTDHLILPPHLRNDLADYAKSMALPRLTSLCHQHHFRLKKLEKIPQSTFSSDIIDYLSPEESSCDIQFKSKETDKEYLSAHKFILTSRNQYFKTMFECSFKESNQSKFMLGDDINIEDFKLVLDYIYANDQSIVNENNAIDLLCLADRFMIDDLKHVCELYLEQLVQSNMSTLSDYIKIKNLNNQVNSLRKTTPTHIKEFLNSILEKKFKEEENLIHQSENKLNSTNSINSITTTIEEDYQSAINSFENICLLLDVADKFLAKRLQRVCFLFISSVPINILSKFLIV